ncbi:MAG: hypothetical protein H6813_03655 [Phycisphaeraceae bacterium]|nr:hypothetical protein [Phycisphaeraceae bacterium]MCB9847043.1 hypothetical protein [Phycisphaeraceae bacterium]
MNIVRMAAVAGAALAVVSAAVAEDFVWLAAPSTFAWDNQNNWFNETTAMIRDGFPDTTADTARIISSTNDPAVSVTGSSLSIGSLQIDSGTLATGSGGATNKRLLVTDNGGHPGLTRILSPGTLEVLLSSHFSNDFFSINCTLEGSADLDLFDGRVNVSQNLTVASNASVSGTGSVNVGGAYANDGFLQANGGGTLQVTSGTPGFVFDWDGPSGQGVVETISGANNRLEILTEVETLFDGFMTITQGSAISVADAWTLDESPGAVLSFNGGTGSATLEGTGLVTVNSAVNVNNGGAIFDVPTHFTNLASISMSPGTALTLDQPSTIDDPASLMLPDPSGGGVFRVYADTTIGSGAGTLDWDTDGGMVTVIGEEATLTIQVALIDTLNNQFDGVIGLSGALHVDVQDNIWDMGTTSSIEITQFSPTPPAISGDTLLFRGAMYVDDSTTVNCVSNMFLEPACTMDFGTHSELVIQGDSIIYPSATVTAPFSDSSVRVQNVFRINGVSMGSLMMIVDPGGFLHLIESPDLTGSSVINDGDLRFYGATLFGSGLVKDFTQSSTGVVNFEIGGTDPGVSHDVMECAAGGTATLAGTVRIDVRFNAPAPGDEYLLIDAPGGVSGVFDTELFIPMGAESEYLIRYDATQVVLVYAPCPEDLNGDGAVDTADLGILLGQFGGAGSADLNNDGVVDTADLGILLGAFGSGCP